MKYFAAVGIVCLLLAGCVVVVFPAVLALTVSAKWLWIYLAYALLVIVFTLAMNSLSEKQGEQNGQDEKGEG